MRTSTLKNRLESAAQDAKRFNASFSLRSVREARELQDAIEELQKALRALNLSVIDSIVAGLED